MKAPRLLILVVFFVVALSPIGFASQKQFSSFSCEALVQAENGVSFEFKIMAKGNKFRMEGVNSGLGAITIYDGTSAYLYMPGQNMAMPIPLGQANSQMIPSNWGIDSHCQNLGSEPADGIACKLYDCQGKKVWVAESTGFPVKVIAHNSQVHYSNFKEGVELDDSLFVLPEGVNKLDMGRILQGAGS